MSVEFSSREVYEILMEVRDKVNELGTQFEGHVENSSDHEKRLRGLELKFYGFVAGLTLTIGGIASRMTGLI